MPVSLFTFIDLYRRILATTAHILTKGVEHAARTGVSERDMLDWRLADDMQPLRFQIMVVCNFARQWPARVAGLPVPDDVDDQLDVAGFHAAIDASRSFLATLTA